ncbi:MAG: hypothetical protein K9J17_13895 [Flavobacteriales bacterium]|nr:hypothetical protein [Flavobacteriales bacterium]
MTRIVTLLLLLFTLTQAAMAGGPWPRKKNSGYAQLGFTYVGYNKFFNHEGKVTDLRRNVTDFTTQLYLDFGITDRLTMTANLPFKYVASSQQIVNSDTTYFRDTVPAGNLFGLNNVMLGFKYNIINKKVLFSAGLNAEANVSKYDSLTTLRTGPSAWVFHPYLSVGSSFVQGKLYTMLDAGYRLRLNNYSDQIDFNWELGYSWNYKTYFILTVAGRYAIKEGSNDNNVTPLNPNGRDLHTTLYPNNQQYVGYGIKFIQKIKKKVHLNAGVYFGMGNMVAATPSYNLGVAYEW